MSRGSGIILFTLLTVLIIACSIWITQPYISDTDPSTYVVVPMLMIPVFAIFMLKDRSIDPKPNPGSTAFGTILFLAFIILALDLRGYLGPLFFTYGMEMLLMPIAILALASLIFGTENLGRFGWLALYSLFASPILFTQIIGLNLGFASANSLLIYYISKLALPALSYVAPITLYMNGNGVAIGNTCIGIGALIGLVMFFLPVAYFMDGRPAKKFLWVLSGFILMLVLNFARMLIIAFAWFSYGPNQSILDVHSFIGQLIFYAVIVIMILLFGKFELSFPSLEFGAEKRQYGNRPIIIAVVLSLLYFAVSLSYLNAATVTIGTLGQSVQFNQNSIASLYKSYVSYNGSSLSELGAGNSSIAIFLQNATQSGQQILVIFAGQSYGTPSIVPAIAANSSWKEYLNGGEVGYLYETGGKSPSTVYYTQVPYVSGGNGYVLSMYAVAPGFPQEAKRCQSAYDYFYNAVSNIAQLNLNSFNSSIDSQYCQLKGVLG